MKTKSILTIVMGLACLYLQIVFQGNFAQFCNILGRDVEYLSQSFESFAYLFVVVFHNQHFLWWVNQLCGLRAQRRIVRDC